jgi:hypothetical protein
MFPSLVTSKATSPAFTESGEALIAISVKLILTDWALAGAWVVEVVVPVSLLSPESSLEDPQAEIPRARTSVAAATDTRNAFGFKGRPF